VAAGSNRALHRLAASQHRRWEYTAGRDLVKALRRVHQEDPLDLVDLHSGGAGPAVAAWSRRAGVPYIAVSHSLRFFTSRMHGHRWETALYYAWANRKAYAGAREVVAVSAALKNELVQFGVPEGKVLVQHTATSALNGIG